MTRFRRSAALIAAAAVIIYGLLTTSDVASVTTSARPSPWLLVLAIAFVLLLVAFWPSRAPSLSRTDRAIMRSAVVLFVGFLMITVQLVRFQIVDSAAIEARTAASPDGQVMVDPRQAIAASDVRRGRILTADGQVIADTVQDPEGRFIRRYPDPATAPLAGYYSPARYGSSRIEAAYDDVLSGKEGGNPFKEGLDDLLHRNREGHDIVLHVDAALQQQAVDLLGDRAGAAVVMDARTGAVLAMASAPTYDPNQLSTAATNATAEELDAVTAYWDQLNAANGSPLLFRPTQGLYVPGSVFKTVTAAAALETGTATPDSVYRDEGALTVGARVIEERNRPDPNRVSYTLSDAYGYSLNVVFAQVGLQLGADQLATYAEQFGFADRIPFDLPVAESRIADDRSALTDQGLLAVTAFGQGQILATPLQMAMVVDAVANGGEMMRPSLVAAVQDGDGTTLSEQDPEVWRRAISEETAGQLQDMMVAAVESGYASGAAIDGYRVGGKTGTAEVGDQPPHAWFVGFAGVDEPEYVVAVVVENGGSGGEVALPIGRELLRTALERTPA